MFKSLVGSMSRGSRGSQIRLVCGPSLSITEDTVSVLSSCVRPCTLKCKNTLRIKDSRSPSVTGEGWRPLQLKVHCPRPPPHTHTSLTCIQGVSGCGYDHTALSSESTAARPLLPSFTAPWARGRPAQRQNESARGAPRLKPELGTGGWMDTP